MFVCTIHHTTEEMYLVSGVYLSFPWWHRQVCLCSPPPPGPSPWPYSRRRSERRPRTCELLPQRGAPCVSGRSGIRWSAKKKGIFDLFLVHSHWRRGSRAKWLLLLFKILSRKSLVLKESCGRHLLTVVKQ